MRNDHDAEDVVQDASLRALRYFGTFTGGNGRAWFLRIVRNTCYAKRGRQPLKSDLFDEEHHSRQTGASGSGDRTPSHPMAVARIERAIAALPARAAGNPRASASSKISRIRNWPKSSTFPAGTVLVSALLSRARAARFVPAPRAGT
jgi:RNA polymerase sigma-70 factor (ECF subfamily)